MNSTSISLFKGGFFDYSNPEASDFNIKDIALGLSHESRFSGQSDRAYFVGQHSVIVSKIVPAEHALAALMHDCAEAFLKDIPTPLKAMLPQYKEIEAQVEKAIFKKFGLAYPMHPCIKEADIRAFVTERRDLQPGIPVEDKYKDVVPLPNQIIAWDSRTCYLNFLRRFEELTK